jgi:hypothetical protein
VFINAAQPADSVLRLAASSGEVQQEAVQLIKKTKYRPGDGEAAHPVAVFPRPGADHDPAVGHHHFDDRADLRRTTTISTDRASHPISSVGRSHGSAQRGDDGEPNEAPRRPAYAVGSINPDVCAPGAHARGHVSSRRRRSRAGGKTSIDVVVTGAGGKPVSGAAIAVTRRSH